MKGKPKNIPSPYKFSGTKIFRDTTALPFADGGPLHDRDINGKLLNSTYASPLGNMFREGGPFGENRGTFDYATSIYASQPGNYYANGGELGEDPVYSYSGRTDSKYKKDSKGNWLISNSSTKGEFIPINDPTGKRTKELNRKATLIQTPVQTSFLNTYKNVITRDNEINTLSKSPRLEDQERAMYLQGQKDIEKHSRELLEKNKKRLIEEQKNSGAATPSDWLWQSAVTGGPVLKGVGALMETIIPGTSLTAGNIAGGAFGVKGVTEVPNTLKAWQDVSKGNKKWQDATLQTGLNLLDFTGASSGTKALLGEGKNLYNTVATGESVLPIAWKSPAVGLTQEASQNMFNSLSNTDKLTDAERALISGNYQYDSKPFTGRNNFPINTTKKTELNNIISNKNLLLKDKAIATRRFNAKNNSLGANFENNTLNFGDRPTSFSAGVGGEGYAGAPDRIVIPNRHLQKMNQNFLANEYSPLSEEALSLIENENARNFASKIGNTNTIVNNERELIGTGLNLKKIGKVKNDIGGYDYIMKPNKYANGGMIKRADGSYSQRGLWDNIRANAGSGKKPTKEMLAQEKKINREYRTGGQFPRPYSLPEDSFKQGGTNLHNSIYASSSAQYPAIYRNGGMTSHFYASNVPDNNISNKDLTYPENSYVYALGGDLNNNNMKYPAASRILKEGSGIHINPANKGKFTASANAAGMGVQEFASHVLANKDNYSATQVKRANFARNAAGWKHEHGGHILAAGGWPPGLKLKNPTLSVMPYYSNAMTGVQAPSAEIGLSGQLKGNKNWTISPHIGVGYNAGDKFPLSGGLDVSYKGLRSPSGRGYANVDIGAGYNPAQGAGIGFEGGYKYRLLGQSNKRGNQIPAGTGALDVMPYAGWSVAKSPEFAGQGFGASDVLSSATYGLNAEAQWRPKLFPNATHKAPVTFFGRGDINLNPVKGKTTEVADTVGDVWQAGAPGGAGSSMGQGYSTSGNVKVNPDYSLTVGARMPIDTIKDIVSSRKGIPAVEGGEYYQETPAGDFTFAQRNSTVDAKGKPTLGQYNESIEDFSKRAGQWGTSGQINPNFAADTETRMENETLPFLQTDYNQPIVEEDYKYGGAMKFKYGGFNNPGFNALPKDVQAKIKARTFGDGGTMPQLTEFNEGGRHEENVLGGIPQGTAGDGRINLVEEGETKLNAANYVFSDTLKVDKGIAAAFNLPKGDIGKTFADVSKKMNRPNSRRDNDTIEQNAIQRDLENLMQAQEAFKQIDLQKDVEMMKNKHPELADAMDAAMNPQAAAPVTPQGAPEGQAPISPEEQAMMEQQMMAQQQGGMPQEQMGQIPMSYGGSIFACGGKMYNYGGNLYPNGGTMATPIQPQGFNWTVQPNSDAMNLQDLRYTYPTDARNEPIYGSRDEAKGALLNNPGSDISRTYYQDRSTGKMGQLLSNAAMQDIRGGNIQSWSPNNPTKLAAEDTFNMGDYYYKHDATPYSGPYGIEPGMEHMSNSFPTGYRNGGRIMRGGGKEFMRNVGSGAYGVGEGLLDTFTFGLTDNLTDKGFDKLSRMGNRTEEEIARDKMIRGFGNTAGAIGGAVLSGGAATGSAISEGAEGLGQGLTNIKGTNEAFDKTVNSLAQVGSMVGGMVGGNPMNAAGGAAQVPQFAQSMMKAGQNPFLKQVTGMAGSMMKTGGHMYPTIYPMYKNNAGPMGQKLTNLYEYGGSFENPRQQMYMPLDGVERTGEYLFAGGGPLDGIDPTTIQQGVSYVTDYLNNPEAAIKMGFDPKLVKEWTDPNTGEYEVPPAYRLDQSTKNFIANLGKGSMEEVAAAGKQFRTSNLEKMPYLPVGTIESNTPNTLMGVKSSNTNNTDKVSIENNPSFYYSNLQDLESPEVQGYVGGDVSEKKVIINGKPYTQKQALQDPYLTSILEPEEIAEYFKGIPTSGSEDEEDEDVIVDEDNIPSIEDEDGDNVDNSTIDEEILVAQNMVKNAKNPKDRAEAEAYLSKLQRMKTGLEDRNVNLQMKQTPLQALGLAAPAAYNIGQGLFGKPMKFNEEDFMNKAKISPYKVNINPQLNEANLAYNSAERALKDMSPGAGAYLTNRSNLANLRSKTIKDILAGKENADAQLQMQSDIQNAQLGAQNIGNKLAIQQLNAQAKAAKQRMLQEGLGQLGQIAQNAGAMDAQEKYMRLISPQYGKTFEYQTIFDQAKNALANYRKNKSSNKEEK